MTLPHPPAPVNAENTTTTPSDCLERNVLVLATGGTLCMSPNEEGAYVAVPRYIPDTFRVTPTTHDVEYYEKYIASRSPHEDTFVLPRTFASVRMGFQSESKRDDKVATRVVYTIHEYSPLIDSSNMTVDDYKKIAHDIDVAYHDYDGFVVLHGTDTLGYTASTLSFMLENLGKPVVLTGAQVPAAEMRTDAFDNIIGSLVVAGNYKIPEVCVFFNRCLFRGNRVQKVNADEFDAFDSPNLRPLVKMGIHIEVNHDQIWRSKSLEKFKVADHWDRGVGLLRIFPAITRETVAAFLENEIDDEKRKLHGVVLQTYGAGNGPSERVDIMAELKKATSRGVLIVNCTQCQQGCVTTAYAAGLELVKMGVMGGHDMTVEAALAKLSYVLGFRGSKTIKEQQAMLTESLRGELTPSDEEMHIEERTDNKFIMAVSSSMNVSSANELQQVKDAIFPALLCSAARKGDCDGLKTLKNQGADYNSSDYDCRTALHIAAAEGHVDCVKELLLNAASVHAKDRSGHTPLFDAIKGRHTEVVKILVETGAQLVVDRLRVATILCRLAKQNDLDGIECWLAGGADVNFPDYDGRTALHIVAGKNDLKGVEFLLEKGADFGLVDNAGFNAMGEAVECGGGLEVVKLLKSAGSVISLSPEKLASTLCGLAASPDSASKINAWHSAGADMNCADYDGRTALHIACSKANVAIAELLIKLGADKNATDGFNQTAKDEALKKGGEAILALFD